MRVLLVGRETDRDQVRPGLLEAGFPIVAELSDAPDAASHPPAFDLIVTAPNGASSSLRASAHLAPDQLDDLEPLTAREHDVLALVAEGLPNKRIAQTLGISDQTVKFHVAAIIAKLGARNRTDVVRRAIRRGLIAV